MKSGTSPEEKGAFNFMEYLKLKKDKTIIIRKAVKTDAAAMLEYIHRISSEPDFLMLNNRFYDSIAMGLAVD